jgi:hypothetical protein
MDALILIGVGIVMWWLYPHTLSIFQRRRLSPLAYWTNRIAITGVAIFIAILVMRG